VAVLRAAALHTAQLVAGPLRVRLRGGKRVATRVQLAVQAVAVHLRRRQRRLERVVRLRQLAKASLRRCRQPLSPGLARPRLTELRVRRGQSLRHHLDLLLQQPLVESQLRRRTRRVLRLLKLRLRPHRRNSVQP
jgi:hypothetical protein